MKSRYRDFSMLTEETVASLAVAKGTHSSVNHLFPARLHYVLSELEAEGSTDIASWVEPHGRSFAVHDKPRFLEHVQRW